MSPEARPAAAVFDPGSAGIPPTLGPALTAPDKPIVLLVAADAGLPAQRTAIALAEARAAAGHATLLGDAGVTDPRLHERLGVENVEGLADIFLFGASLEHVCVQPGEGEFDFIPTGAYVPDPAAVLDSGRWDRIAEEVEESGALLLLFVPSTTPGIGALSRRIGRAILIGDEAGVERARPRLDSTCRVLGVLHPAGAGAVVSAEDGARASAREAARLTEPLVFRPAEERRRVLSPLLVIVLIVALAAGGWFAYRRYLAPAPPRAETPDAAEPPSPAEAEPGPAVETPIPMSVAVEAHQDLESARRRVASLREAEPSVGFYLAPLSVDGDLYYRLMAGPVRTREEADALMQRLVEAGHKTAPDTWAIRPTELAFRFGEYDTEAEAQARVDSLDAEDIPAYIIPIRYDPAPPRYRVYGGAYESATEAAVMQQMLDEAGIEAPLVQRTGEPQAGDG